MTIWIENVPMVDGPQWGATSEGLRTPYPYRRVRRADTPPPGSVWLEPACAVNRLWSHEGDPWGRCDHCALRSVAYAPVWDWLRKPEAWRVTT